MGVTEIERDSTRSLGLSIASALLVSVPLLLFRGVLDTVVEDYPWALNTCDQASVAAWVVAGGLTLGGWLLVRLAFKASDPTTISPMVAIVVGIFSLIGTVVWIVGIIDAGKAIC